MLNVSRRQFLMVAGIATTSAAVFSVYRSISRDDLVTNPDRMFEKFIAAGHFSADLGEKYLEITGKHTDTTFELLQTEMMNSLPDIRGDLQVGIRQRVQQDFVHGNFCQIDGWQLARTECQLAAIAFLFRESGGFIKEPATSGPLDDLGESFIAQVNRWGPKSGVSGEGFNLQPNGKSSMWFRFDEIDTHPYAIFFGSEAARTSVHGDRNLITVSLTRGQVRQATSKQNEIPVHLVDLSRGSKQLIGFFNVHPAKR